MKNKKIFYINAVLLILLTIWLGASIGFETYIVHTNGKALTTTFYLGSTLFKVLLLLSLVLLSISIYFKNKEEHLRNLFYVLLGFGILSSFMIFIRDLYYIYLISTKVPITLPPTVLTIEIITVVLAFLTIVLYITFFVLNYFNNTSLKKTKTILIGLILFIFLIGVINFTLTTILTKQFSFSGLIIIIENYLLVPLIYFGLFLSFRDKKYITTSIISLIIFIVFLFTTLILQIGAAFVSLVYPLGQTLAYLYSLIMLILFAVKEFILE